MSGASLPSIAAPSMHRPSARRSRLNPLEALERGFALFQSTFTREAWRYYVGAAPLVLCLIPIWVIDGQIRISDSALLLQAALLAGAYLLRARMVAGYVQRVRERAFGMPLSKPESLGATAAALGRLLAWKITLSAAALATLPTVAAASWFYSACQFANLEAQEDASERHSFGGCLSLATQWFGDGVLLFLMLFPLWIAVWMNGLILAMALPALLHSIFGVNTLLSTRMGVFSLLRSSAFWLSLFAGAWLALDPVVKCTFIAVYQHLRSRREGDDLRGALAGLPREQQRKAELITSSRPAAKAIVASLVMIVAILFGASQTADARAANAPQNLGSAATADSSATQARAQKLRQALDEESQRAIYRWHDAEHPSPPTWLDNLLSKIGHAFQRAWRAFVNFLRKLWPRRFNFSPEGKGGWRLNDIRLWLVLLFALTLGIGASFFWFWRQRQRQAAQLSIPIALPPLPDLDAVVASERSEDEWFTMAEGLEERGELKLALRAAYLALLSGLAQREWLTIRRDRTNREYLDEFSRRWRRRPQATVEARLEIPEKFRTSLRLFDRVWYGSYALTPAAVVAYRESQRELLNHV